mmetsp:Transcript_24735/g.76281  ORF Transcript_24735/g.76281 Transcript_24735/m.76281 type:complete len:433 (+) Transcript_24735:221-1519(+)
MSSSAASTAKPPCPSSAALRSQAFVLEQMRHSMRFFSPERAVDPAGGYFHFFAEDGSIFDADTKVLVTQARFIFSLAVAAEHLGDPKYLAAVEHGVTYLARGPLRNAANGAYHWVLKDGKPTSSKIFTYGLGQCLLAYAAATRAGCAAARPFLDETWETLEKHLFVPADGLYAEEADERWTKDPYRSESGNLHMTEALIACYEATSDEKYLDRAVLVADRVCNRAAGQTQGLVWEHFKEDWSANLEFDNDDEALKIFRPWGFQPGHQVEWARFLLTLARHAEAAGAPRWWLVPKAKFLFDVAVEHAWDAEHGGLCYSIDLDASVCNHDKIFWVQCEAIGTAAILGSLTGEDKYWATYDKLWRYSWDKWVDHEHGSWLRRMNREHVPYFTEKTKLSLCVDPDFHMMGAYAGALTFMRDAGVGDGDARGWFGCL